MVPLWPGDLARRDFFFLFHIDTFGEKCSCETPRVMPNYTSGWSLRWFHHRLVGLVGTPWLTGLSIVAKGRAEWLSRSSRGWDLKRRLFERNPQARALDLSAASHLNLCLSRTEFEPATFSAQSSVISLDKPCKPDQPGKLKIRLNSGWRKCYCQV